MNVKIKEKDDKGLRIIYGNHHHFTISASLLRTIEEVKTVLGSQRKGYKDELIRKVKERIGNDGRLCLELAVYGRAVLGMHPCDLTDVSRWVSIYEAQPYRAISLQVGKHHQKLMGVR